MRDDFEKALDADPEDWETRLVYADWLEEQGDYDLMLAQRWMARHKQCPDWHWDAWLWFFEPTYILKNRRTSMADVPPAIYKLLHGEEVGTDQVYNDDVTQCYNTRQNSEHDLGRVLAAMERWPGVELVRNEALDGSSIITPPITYTVKVIGELPGGAILKGE